MLPHLCSLFCLRPPTLCLILTMMYLVLLGWNMFTPRQSPAESFGYSWGYSCFVCLSLQEAVVPSKPGAGEMPHAAACCSAPGPAVSPSRGLTLPQQPYLPLDLLSSVQHPHGSPRKSLGILRYTTWGVLVLVNMPKNRRKTKTENSFSFCVSEVWCLCAQHSFAFFRTGTSNQSSTWLPLEELLSLLHPVLVSLFPHSPRAARRDAVPYKHQQDHCAWHREHFFEWEVGVIGTALIFPPEKGCF